MPTKTRYESVTDVNNYIHNMFRRDYSLHSVHMTGEISNYRPRPGHQYLTLKDDYSHISAVIWASTFRKVKYHLKNGMKVNVVGTIQTYVRNGQYQICIWHIEPNGIGQLYVRLKQVQRRLDKEGLFNPFHKRNLVPFPKRIAVITSPSGAVIRDIIKTVRARYPIAQIVLYPADVQGKNSAPSLIRRLEQVSNNHDCDEVIIGRGGGSLEDLWGFESPRLAYAIYDCSIPVVSSVGHGTDRTTADMVADKSVVTPTAAGEACTPILLSDLMDNLQDYKQRLLDACLQKIDNSQQALSQLEQSAVFVHPETICKPQQQSLDYLYNNLANAMQIRLERASDKVTDLQYLLRSNSPKSMIVQQSHMIKLYSDSLRHNMKIILARKGDRFRKLVAVLDQLSPLKRMAQGYSLVTKNKHLVKDARQLKPDDTVDIYLSHGHHQARITK